MLIHVCMCICVYVYVLLFCVFLCMCVCMCVCVHEYVSGKGAKILFTTRVIALQSKELAHRQN